MHRRIIHVQGRSPFNRKKMPPCHLSGFSRRFHLLSRAHGQIPYVLLTRSPLTSNEQAHLPSVRLACIRHAASVHPEPGSNSPFDLALTLSSVFFLFLESFSIRVWIDVFLFSFQRPTSRTPFRCSLIISNSFPLCQSLFFIFFTFYVLFFYLHHLLYFMYHFICILHASLSLNCFNHLLILCSLLCRS